jgi:hypothetical protein
MRDMYGIEIKKVIYYIEAISLRETWRPNFNLQNQADIRAELPFHQRLMLVHISWRLVSLFYWFFFFSMIFVCLFVFAFFVGKQQEMLWLDYKMAPKSSVWKIWSPIYGTIQNWLDPEGAHFINGLINWWVHSWIEY